MSLVPEDRFMTQMVIPVSKETYFNTKWQRKEAQLCAYDMLYHPPDYNPKSARSDRQEPKIIRKNIWEQVKILRAKRGLPDIINLNVNNKRCRWKRKRGILNEDDISNPAELTSLGQACEEFHKGISSTTHFRHGRPKWKPLDLPTKEYVRVQVKNENPHMRIYNVLEWAVLLNDGKPSLCD